MHDDFISSLAFRELHHRIANTLTVLRAGLRFELAHFTDPDLQKALRRHERQIMAVAELHRFFAANAGDNLISIGVYFETLCAVLGRSLLEPIGVHCQAFIEEGRLSAAKREHLGLIIAELVANAAKHAFHKVPDGRLRIELLHDGKQWSCTVSDDGIGMQRVSPGTGSQITDSLIEALGGRSTIRTGHHGTAVSVSFPY